MKNTTLKLIAIALFAVAAMSFCVSAAIRVCESSEFFDATAKTGSSRIVTHNLSEMTFRGISAHSCAEVAMRAPEDASRDVILSVSENIAEHVSLTVKNGIMEIMLKNTFKPKRNVTFHVSVPYTKELEMLETSGAASISVTGPVSCSKMAVSASGASKISLGGEIVCNNAEIESLGASKVLLEKELTAAERCTLTASGVAKIEAAARCDRMKAEATGASKIKARIECRNAEAEVHGASKMVLGGSCDTFSAEASGSSSLEAEEFAGRLCSAEASGASKIRVWCTEKLKTDTSGASKIEYKGDCSVISSDRSVRKIK